MAITLLIGPHLSALWGTGSGQQDCASWHRDMCSPQCIHVISRPQSGSVCPCVPCAPRLQSAFNFCLFLEYTCRVYLFTCYFCLLLHLPRFPFSKLPNINFACFSLLPAHRLVAKLFTHTVIYTCQPRVYNTVLVQSNLLYWGLLYL